jgi:chromate reductase
MADKIHVLGFSGSLRKGSFNTALLRAAAELLPEGMALEIFDLSPLPLFNSDLEAQGMPEVVKNFKARIAAADALLIATPEYNYSIPGVLKNAIDWASRTPKDSPLNGKPLAMMGAAGMMGTVRAQMHLRDVLLHNNVMVLNKPEVYITRAAEKFDAERRLIDEPARQRIRELLAALRDWTLRLK